MVENMSLGEKLFMVFNYLLLTLIGVLCVYPMLHVLFSSLSDPLLLMRHSGVMLKPLGFNLRGYEMVFSNRNIWTGYMNTIFYVVAGTALNMLMTIMGAYALSRKGYKLKKLCTFGMVLTMYIHGGLIPNYLLVRWLGMYNTRWAILVPGMIATWNMIVMKTAFQAIPASLEESAKIDGANDFVILFKIFLPVSTATLAVITLFYAVGRWNAWFNAMLYLRERTLYPLQLFLREILISASMQGNGTGGDVSQYDFMEEVVKNSTIIIATVPILCIYPFVQRFFIRGVMMGSLKE